MKNQIKTLLLLGVLSALVIGIGGALGPGYLYGFTAFALLMNLGAYFFSDRIVLAMHRAHEVPYEAAPQLHRMVEEVAAAAQIPKPRVFVIPEAQPNAFATGRNPEKGVVAVTQGIVNLLNERELKGVIAHELAHIKNRDVLIATIAAGIAAAVTYLAHAAHFASFFGGTSQDNDDEGGGWLQTMLMVLLAPIAATLVQLGISRSREFHADETAARLTGDPEALASALAKMEQTAHTIQSHVEPATASLFIVNPLSGRSLMGLFSTHPPMDERIRRLRGLDMGTRRLVHDF